MRFLSVFCLITNYFHKKSAPDQWRTISFKKADCIQSPCFCLDKIHRRHKVANCFYCRPQLLQDCSHCVWSPRRGKGGKGGGEEAHGHPIIQPGGSPKLQYLAPSIRFLSRPDVLHGVYMSAVILTFIPFYVFMYTIIRQSRGSTWKEKFSRKEVMVVASRHRQHTVTQTFTSPSPSPRPPSPKGPIFKLELLLLIFFMNETLDV